MHNGNAHNFKQLTLDRLNSGEPEDSVEGVKVLVLFGTRPEAIKLAPVIHELWRRGLPPVVVSSSQHKSLLKPFLELLQIKPDFDLAVMSKNQSPNEVCSRVLQKLDKVLDAEKPYLILVQGDTTTTLAGAIAGFNRRIPVAHVEAGLRSGNVHSPFPEEMNRILTTRLASLHFAATEKNRRALAREGVATDKIFLTGNPVVDSLQFVLKNSFPSKPVEKLIEDTRGLKRVLLTTHRRESFGEKMGDNLIALRNFIQRHANTCLIFPVHPNPNVKAVTEKILKGCERVFLLEPLDYADFVALMKKAWLIVSDSGGVQEEAPSLGKPLLILRENTERPEAVESQVAKLVGGGAKKLAIMLEENYMVETWIKSVRKVENPFGDGKAAKRIVDVIQARFANTATTAAAKV